MKVETHMQFCPSKSPIIIILKLFGDGEIFLGGDGSGAACLKEFLVPY